MKHLKRFLWLLISFMASVCAVMPCFAAERSFETEVINNLAIGDISIDLLEYDLNDAGEEIPCRQSVCVLPGQRLKRIISVINKAGSAWVRVRLEYLQDDILHPCPESMVILSDDEWIFRGGYFYRTVPLDPGEGSDLSRGIIIPPSWGEEEAGKGFEFIVTAQAVQEANFTPDFSLDDPWFGTLIETCVHTAQVPVALSHETFSILFEGGAEGLIKTGEDFFANFGRLMPGDSAADTVVIRNDYASPITLYFRTEGIADDPLAGMVHLTIQSNKGIIFDGKVSESRDEIKIAALDKGEEETLSYTLFVPPEFGNSYALTRTADKWIFRASLDIAEESAAPAAFGKRHSGNGAEAVVEEAASQDPFPAAQFAPYLGVLSKTGAGKALLIAGVLLAASGLCLLIALMISLSSRAACPPGRKKKRGEDK